MYELKKKVNIIFFSYFVIGHHGTVTHITELYTLTILSGQQVPEMKTKHDNDLCPAMVIENGRRAHKFRSFRPSDMYMAFIYIPIFIIHAYYIMHNDICVVTILTK